MQLVELPVEVGAPVRAGERPAQLLLGQLLVEVALEVADERLTAVDNSCTLTEPVEIRDMQAVLYDANCSAEGEETGGRIMLMTSPP